MASPPAGPPKGLSERDISYLKLLKTLKGAGAAGGGGDLGVVRRIAAWIDSVPVLNFVCVNQRWFDDWEVKEALLHNDLCPARHRTEIEKAIAIFDLLREMDDPAHSQEEVAEIQEDLRYLFKTLADHDRNVVKARAYELSSSRRQTSGAGKPATPLGTPAESVGAALVRGAEPTRPDDTRARSGLLAGEFDSFDEARAELFDDGGVTQQIHAAEVEALSAEDEAIATAVHLLATEIEAAPSAPAPALPAPVARTKAPPAAPARTAAPAAPGPVPVEVAPAPEPVPEEQDEPALHEEPVPSGAEASTITGLPVDQRAALAARTDDVAVLGVLAHDSVQDVQLALLSNPALTDRHVSVIARRASARVAEEIHRNRKLFMRPMVRQGLLACPNTPSAALLEIVNSVSDLTELMRLIKNPMVRFLEVKAKARARLSQMFRAMGSGEKLAAVRRTGSALLKELWTDFFRDEALVVACLQQAQVDTGIVLEIARSRIAPRRALEVIGNSPAWTANYAIRLELVLNPKTPRQVVTKLLPKLTPADRKMVKNNPALPESIRKFA